MDLSLETVIESLTNAMGYRIESWDGYIVAIAKAHSAPIVYTLDEKMKKRVKDLHEINPTPMMFSGNIMNGWRKVLANKNQSCNLSPQPDFP